MAGATVIKVYGTTDVTDSNLLAGLIAPAYLSATGNTINYVAQGSGAALDSAAVPANNADAVMVHSPPLEALWLSANSEEPLGRSIFYNDYLIVGPTSDPAGVIANGHRHDAIGALQDIASAGGSGNAIFNSRDNASGTNVQEQVMWGLTTSVTKQQAWNRTTGDTTRYTPWDGTNTHSPHNFPTWYVSTGLGQGANLTATNNCSPSKCYTMVDRGTWAFVSHANLKIVSDANSAGATGGASLLTNPFHAYVVKTAPNKTAALGFLDFLTSEDFQNGLLPSFTSGGVQAAYPDAFASVASSMPTSAPTSSTISISATLTYPPPVAQAISGMPVQLQQTTDGGTTWTNVGSAQNSNGSGAVSFSPTLTTDTCYRLHMGTYDDSASASRFSPNDNTALGPNQDGCVSAT